MFELPLNRPFRGRFEEFAFALPPNRNTVNKRLPGAVRPSGRKSAFLSLWGQVFPVVLLCRGGCGLPCTPLQGFFRRGRAEKVQYANEAAKSEEPENRPNRGRPEEDALAEPPNRNTVFSFAV